MKNSDTEDQEDVIVATSAPYGDLESALLPEVTAGASQDSVSYRRGEYGLHDVSDGLW